MGGVSVDSGGKGGKKSVDAPVNMVPMIDLLICCIAFLLMTAVWVQTGAVQASQPRGAPAPDSPPNPEQQDQLKIQISPTGLQVGVNAADMRTINRTPQRFTELKTLLEARRQANQQNREVWLQPDGAVDYSEIIAVMDTVYEVYGSAARGEVTIRFL
jgi:biopolymer transport protein ExbD